MEYDKIFERAETWLKTYDSLEDIDDYFYPPSKEDIKRSIEVTKELRKNNVIAPLGFMLDGDRGICFEWHKHFHKKYKSLTLEIEDDQIELLVFDHDYTLIRRIKTYEIKISKEWKDILGYFREFAPDSCREKQDGVEGESHNDKKS
jgi:hypothetical protein